MWYLRLLSNVGFARAKLGETDYSKCVERIHGKKKCLDGGIIGDNHQQHHHVHHHHHHHRQ